MTDPLEREIAKLTMRLTELQAENRHLRKRIERNRPGGRIARKAHRDALHLLNLYYAGYSISRPAAVALGFTERRWYWARALLMLAQVHNGRTVTEEQPAAALEALGLAVARIKQQGIAPLRAHNTKRY